MSNGKFGFTSFPRAIYGLEAVFTTQLLLQILLIQPLGLAGKVDAFRA